MSNEEKKFKEKFTVLRKLITIKIYFSKIKKRKEKTKLKERKKERKKREEA